MKKLLFSAAVMATGLAFGQITLEHSFPEGETATIYKDETNTFYITIQRNSEIVKIYNSDYSLYKTFTLNIPSGFTSVSYPEADQFQFTTSKYVFNNDDKLEIFITYNGNGGESKLQIVNEDGVLIKDFDGNFYDWDIALFTDKTINKNKLVLLTTNNVYEVYQLPTSSLSSKEIQTKGKLSAFPVPANKTLNIINPNNGTNVVEIYDASGKLFINKSFPKNENRISVDVENLTKGAYTYKIGNQSAKFIKN